MTKTFCYWSIADGRHGSMAATMVASARAVGVKEDFHIYTDMPSIEGAITHPCGKFDKTLYMFKFHFLKEEVSKLDYTHFVFLDADNFFTRNPGDLSEMMGDDKVFVQLENRIETTSKRQDWWGCPVSEYANFMKSMGAAAGKFYNCNAGFWIVAKTAIDEFYAKATYIFAKAQQRGWSKTTEEFALAGIGLTMQDREKRTFEDTSWLWLSDWTGFWKGRLPEYKEWQFEDYMSGEKKMVKSCIVHAMRSKEIMIERYNTNNLPKYEGGFWIGHQLLGDVIGFVAAAHLYSIKTGKPTKVWFQESRKDILKYFDGVEWVPRESIPNAIDAGRNPSNDEWNSTNGVKRFYKWMDSTLTNPKSFDIHMKGEKVSGKKLIGLITHANTQGDIPNHIVDEMITEARKKYPEHQIVAIGNFDNKYIPNGVIDWRQKDGDITWIVETIKKLDLLITPQSGPCFIAAGFKVPMWVYKSKEVHWDNVLNYDTYKVERWWEREDKYGFFDDLYKRGGWNGMGSGPGSLIKNNEVYISLLKKIIDSTPSIKTIVDIGCGDWQIMKELNITKKYIGIDVSVSVIGQNNEKYRKENIDFVVGNVVTDTLPSGDFAIIKDVLQHLPNDEVKICLNKLKQYEFCIIVNDHTESNLGDIFIGEWRPVNVLLDPFNQRGITIMEYNGKQVILIINPKI